MIPVTLRIADWWLERLKKRAGDLSKSLHEQINHCDLIRDIIFSTYVDRRYRTLFPLNCRDCARRMQQEKDLALLKAYLADDSNAQNK